MNATKILYHFLSKVAEASKQPAVEPEAQVDNNAAKITAKKSDLMVGSAPKKAPNGPVGQKELSKTSAASLLAHLLGKKASEQPAVEPEAQVDNNAAKIDDSKSELVSGKGPAKAPNKNGEEAAPKPKVTSPDQTAQHENNEDNTKGYKA